MIARYLAAFAICGGLLAGALISHSENASGSMPTGGYWTLPLPVHVGDLALGCMDSAQQRHAAQLARDLKVSGLCGNTPGLLKIVVAVAGDRAVVTPAGVCVNGSLLAHSRPLAGASLAPAETLESGRVWLWSPVSAALDSRYLGSVRPIARAYADRPLTPRDAARLRPQWSGRCA